MNTMMSGLIVGVILGLIVGVGLSALYLALSERSQEVQPSEAWIDEAIERAFEAVERKNRLEI